MRDGHCHRTSLRRLAHRVPFAQRLRVARRHVGIVRIGADARARFSTSARTCCLRPASARPRRPSRRRAGRRPPAPRLRPASTAEVMQTSARSTSDERGEQLRVGDVHDRRRLQRRADALCARSISSAPVTTRRTRRTLRHFSASASSRQDAGISGNSFEMHRDASSPDSARSHASSAVKDSIGASQVTVQRNSLVDHGERGLARRRRDRIAVERVLADVEIERREVGRS